MYLFRVQLPETPGALGQVATAMGAVGADIQALEIVDHSVEAAVDDFIVDLPPEAMPDSLIAACQAIDGVRVLWVSRSHAEWTIASDIELLNNMAADPVQAVYVLARDIPNVLHSSWAVLVGSDKKILYASETAPEFTDQGWEAIGSFDEVRSQELPDGWMPYYGESIVAIAPLGNGQALIVGRQGGPAFLPSELTRLRHFVGLATS